MKRSILILLSAIIFIACYCKDSEGMQKINDTTCLRATVLDMNNIDFRLHML